VAKNIAGCQQMLFLLQLAFVNVVGVPFERTFRAHEKMPIRVFLF
jgi:hypothetical protein